MLGAIALGTALAPLNATMVAVALKSVAQGFETSVSSATWIVVAYLIVSAVVQPIGGRFGDLLGRRRLFLGALTGVLVTTIACALAPNLPFLIAMRILQAACSATALPNGMAMIREAVPEGRRGSVFGVVGAAAGLATALGPPLGSGIAAGGSWRDIFWLGAGLTLIALVLAWRALPRQERARREKVRFDPMGVTLLAISLTAAALMASTIGQGHPAWTALLAVAAVVFLGLFIYHEHHGDAPIMPLGLFRVPPYVGALVTVATFNWAVYSLLLVIPLFVTKVQGRADWQVGPTLLGLALSVVLLAPLGGRLADRLGRRTPAVIGAVLVIAGVIPLLALSASWPLWSVVGLLTLIGAGTALQMPAVQASSVDALPARDAGVASGVFSTARYVGLMSGSAVVVAVLGSGDAADDAVTVAKIVTVLWIALGAVLVGACACLLLRGRTKLV